MVPQGPSGRIEWRRRESNPRPENGNDSPDKDLREGQEGLVAPALARSAAQVPPGTPSDPSAPAPDPGAERPLRDRFVNDLAGALLAGLSIPERKRLGGMLAQAGRKEQEP